MDVLTGGLGTDLACAVDDETTAEQGVEDMLGLAVNDEELGDEEFETAPRRYLLTRVDGMIDALIDEETGVLTFTAFESGSVDYEVRRYLNNTDDIASLATAFITILSDDDEGSDEDSDDENSDHENSGDENSGDENSDDKAAAALPDTGAATNLQLIGGTGIAALIVGLFMVVATPRRRAAAHRAGRDGPPHTRGDAGRPAGRISRPEEAGWLPRRGHRCLGWGHRSRRRWFPHLGVVCCSDRWGRAVAPEVLRTCSSPFTCIHCSMSRVTPPVARAPCCVSRKPIASP